MPSSLRCRLRSEKQAIRIYARPLAFGFGLRHTWYMGWFGRGSTVGEVAAARALDWQRALGEGRLPAHVRQRLDNNRSGREPWVATMTPAELLLAHSHGVRPLATVSGTCWFHYGWSWTEGHAEGWHQALDRMRIEAREVGANAVVDVRLRTLRHKLGASMDFTLIGTAVRIEALRASPDPVVATVPALEFVRLLDADIVPVGIAVGARYDWLGGNSGWGNWGDAAAVRQLQWQEQSWTNQPLTGLTDFWERIRRDAHAELRRAASKQGNGVLAHTQFGQLLRQERDKQPPAYLGRHIVVGTVVDAKRGSAVSMHVTPVVDMQGGSTLGDPTAHRHSAYDLNDEEGAI
jgi:hypothetical protein